MTETASTTHHIDPPVACDRNHRVEGAKVDADHAHCAEMLARQLDRNDSVSAGAAGVFSPKSRRGDEMPEDSRRRQNVDPAGQL